MSEKRGRPFEPGNQIGRGRPRGSRNKKWLTVDRLLGEYAESIVRKCVLMALHGDQTAMRLCMERLGAPQRESHLKMKAPLAQTAKDVKQSLAFTIAAVTAGKITPSQGELITRMLDVQRRGIESVDLEARIEKMENSNTELNG